MKRSFSIYRCSIAMLVLFCLAACDEKSYEDGYEKGLAEGYQTGYVEGTRDGSNKTALKYESQWGLTGLGIGVLVGGGLVALFTRKYLAARYRAWSNRKLVAKWVGRCEVDLDDDIQARVVQLGARKRRLEEELSRDGGRLIASANATLLGSLSEFDEGVLKLAGLLQRLRGIREEIGGAKAASNARLVALESRLKTAESDLIRSEIHESVVVERQRLHAARTNMENIRRCELKLESLGSFLDRMIIESGNMRTLEHQGAFEQFEGRVGAELEQMRVTYERTLVNLLETMDDSGEERIP